MFRINPEVRVTEEDFLASVKKIRIINELKYLLQISGGMVRSQKRLKSIYIFCQAQFPEIFSSMWDGFFFGPFMSDLADALGYLCLEEDGCTEILWTKPNSPEPIHHIYKLKDKQFSVIPQLNEDEIIQLQSSVIALNLLPTNICISFLFLIEALNESYYTQTNERKEKWFKNVHHIPDAQLSNLDGLIEDLRDLGINYHPDSLIEPLKNVYDLDETQNIYSYLQFYIDRRDKENIFSLYKQYDRLGSFKIKRTSTNKLKVIVNEKNIPQTYKYLSRTYNQNLGDYRKRILDDWSFEQYVNECIRRIQFNIPHCANTHNTKLTMWLRQQKNYLIHSVNKEIQENTVRKMKKIVELVDSTKYGKFIDYRYNSIIHALQQISAATRKQPIKFSFVRENNNAYKRAFPKKNGSIVCMEFEKDFFKEALSNNPLRSSYDNGVLIHINHFFQPEDVCKIVNKSFLKKFITTGGPIIL